MSAEFKNSQTCKNLMRAFAGESQARNRYTFAASQAKNLKLHVLDAVFTFTAGQEKEHAEIFYGFLKPQSKETIMIDGGYPVDITDSPAELLRMAQHNEFEEYDSVYKAFANTAREEGFHEIAAVFENIAKIEKTHGERFGEFADMLEKNTLFSSESECSWICLNCGHIHTGLQAPPNCPVCKHDRGYFIRTSMAPFTK